MGAQYDAMNPAENTKMAALMPNATSGSCEIGSHLSMWDDQASYFGQLPAFLQCV